MMRIFRFKNGWTVKLNQLIGQGGCHFVKRWTIESPAGYGLRLHRFYPDVEELTPHDHPWWFITFVLRGDYVDVTCREGVEVRRDFIRAPAVRFRGVRHEHRTITSAPGAWTIVINGADKRTWGFWPTPGRWLAWQEFRDRGLGRAACERDGEDAWTPER